MIFALSPPPPLPLRCNIRRGNRCNLPLCVLRVFRGVCSVSDPLPFQKERKIESQKRISRSIHCMHITEEEEEEEEM